MTLRMATPSDAETICTIYAPIVLETPISFELTPPPPREMQARIQRCLQQFPWLVCEIEDDVVGYAYAGPHRIRDAYQWATEVSVYVAATARRRGVGQGLYTALLEVLRAQGYYQAYAGIVLPNPASVALHEQVGFTRLGVYDHIGYKMGAWHSVGWWQLALQPLTADPHPPQGITEITGMPDFVEALRKGMALLR